MLSTQQSQNVAAWIFNAEARRDKKGLLKVYPLPVGDGGGSYEVAGINDRYHPQKARDLKILILAGHQDQAAQEATAYIDAYTAVPAQWGTSNAAEAFLKDCTWNRGAKGALRILQLALHVADDGKMGRITRSAITEFNLRPIKNQLANLRTAREAYERRIAPPVGARAKFWPGLVNRWNNAATMALDYA